MMRKFFILLAFLGLSAFEARAEQLVLHGSTTVANNLMLLYEKKIEALSGVDIIVVANGSSRGIEGLENGQAAIGMVSAELPLILEKLEMRDRAGDFQAHKVGEIRVAFTVHPNNPVRTLSGEQVREILLGHITNWSEVGGKSMPIMVVTEYAGGGIRTTVEAELLDKKSITSKARQTPNATQINSIAARLPLSFAPLPQGSAERDENLVIVKTDVEIMQPLILVTKGETTPAMRKVIEAAAEVGKGL